MCSLILLGAGGSESVEAGIEAIRTADEITLATVHVHEAGLQGAAEPTTQDSLKWPRGSNTVTLQHFSNPINDC